MLFFLNPISIIITGYHSQFDNLAILVAFCAVLAGERIKGRAGKSALLVGIGLSLALHGGTLCSLAVKDKFADAPHSLSPDERSC